MGLKNVTLKDYEEFHHNTECLPDVIVQQLIADVPLEPFEKYIDRIMTILEPALEKAQDYSRQLWQDAEEKFNSEHTPLTPNLFPTPSPSPHKES